MDNRLNTVYELLRTEENYQNSLRSIFDVYAEPLRYPIYSIKAEKFTICDVTCQNQALVTEICCRVITQKECDLSFHLIHYLCFYALSIQSFADRKKL